MAFCIAAQSAFRARILPLTAAVLLAAATTSQDVTELRLKDGRVVVGKVAARGDNYEVTTQDGSLTIAQSDVLDRRSSEDLLEALRKKAKTSGDSAFAHLNLAKQAREYGLEREMWRLLDKTLDKLAEESAGGNQTTTEPSAMVNAAAASQPRNNPVERRLRDFLAQLEPELLPRSLRQAPLDKRITAMLRLLPANTIISRAAAIEELMVREPNADQYLRQQARRNPNERQRIAALTALQRRKVTGNDRFVLRTTVLDASKRVRSAAIDIGKPTVAADDITYMAAGLAHSNAKVRVRTAEALGELGHDAAINLLVKAGPHAATGLAAPGGDGPQTRAHVAFLNQQAYIRDFDVEVAQSAFIADPRVDVLQSGSVLDVTVAGVYEVRTILKAYRVALQQLTNQDPGADPRLWGEWLNKLAPAVKPAATGKH